MFTIDTRINLQDVDQQRHNLDQVKAEMTRLKNEFDKNMADLQARASNFESMINMHNKMHKIVKTVLTGLPIEDEVTVWYDNYENCIRCLFNGDLDAVVSEAGASRNSDGFYSVGLAGYDVEFGPDRHPDDVSVYIHNVDMSDLTEQPLVDNLTEGVDGVYNIQLPDGWEEESVATGARYVYWSEDGFASVDVSNQFFDTNELQVIVNMVDKKHKTSDSMNYKVAVENEADWNRVTQDAVDTANKQLKNMMDDNESLSDQDLMEALNRADKLDQSTFRKNYSRKSHRR